MKKLLVVPICFCLIVLGYILGIRSEQLKLETNLDSIIKFKTDEIFNLGVKSSVANMPDTIKRIYSHQKLIYKMGYQRGLEESSAIVINEFGANINPDSAWTIKGLYINTEDRIISCPDCTSIEFY